MLPTLCVGSLIGAWVITREQITGQILDKDWTETGQTLDKHWTRAAATAVNDEQMNGLNELAPKAKARRFRALLPMIEAKIEAGVRHADIIRALEEQGLPLPENAYFTCLRRYRRNRSRGRQEAQAGSAHSRSSAASGEQPATARQGGENAARRPPTFDYDVRSSGHRGRLAHGSAQARRGTGSMDPAASRSAARGAPRVRGREGRTAPG